MTKLKMITLLLVFSISGNALFAQSIDDGKRFYNYERYNSAQTVFNNLVSANPGNAEAVYWLGQTMLSMNNIAGAKALYQKTLMADPNSPLIIAGMGQVALMENNTSDARNRFETAISLSKSKDANVLNAVGRANLNAKNGDIMYAIEKLRQASDLNKKSPEILINLGDAYRKVGDGSNAQVSYQNALNLDPKNARASYSIGRIYETQGPAQESIFTQYYNDAITKDPNFAPAYERLATYYYTTDINKAKMNLDKYITVADANSHNCYLQAAYQYASGNNQGAISKANDCIAAAGNDVYPNLYGIEAYAYNRMGDSLNAKKYFETYFQKQMPDQFGPADYATYAKVLLKFPGNQQTVNSLIQKAVESDSLVTDKVNFESAAATAYLSVKDYADAAFWYSRLLYLKKDPSKTDLFNAGYNFYRADSYQSSDSVFKVYQLKYPDDIFGYYWSGRAEAEIDSTGKLGLAKGNYEKVIQIGEASTDTAAVKSDLINAYLYMGAYNYSRNDKDGAIKYYEKILAIDPSNATAEANIKAIKASPILKEKTKASGKTKEKAADGSKQKEKEGVEKEKEKNNK